MKSVEIPHTHGELAVFQDVFQDTAVQHSLVHHTLAAENIHGQHEDIGDHQKEVSVAVYQDIQNQERRHKKDPLGIPCGKSENGKTYRHAEKYRPGSQFSLIFRFFLVGPHQNESRNRSHEIDAAEEAHGKRFLHIFQRSEPEHVPPESLRPQIRDDLYEKGQRHHNRISDQVADLLLLQKDKRQKIQDRMVLEGGRDSEHQRRFPQFPSEIKPESQHHKKHGEDIVLAENELAEYSHGEDQKREFAQKGFFLAESHLFSDQIHQLGGDEVKDHRQQLVPHHVHKTVGEYRLRHMAGKIKRQIPYGVGDKGAGKVIGPVSSRLLVARLIKIRKVFIHEERTVSRKFHVGMHTGHKQKRQDQNGYDPVQTAEFISAEKTHSFPFRRRPGKKAGGCFIFRFHTPVSCFSGDFRELLSESRAVSAYCFMIV